MWKFSLILNFAQESNTFDFDFGILRNKNRNPIWIEELLNLLVVKQRLEQSIELDDGPKKLKNIR